MQPRILHLIDSSGFYGAERVVVTLCSEIQKNSLTPLLGCIMAQNSELPKIGIVAKDLGIEVLSVLQASKFDWQSVRKIIDVHDIDIIHCHGYKPSLLSFIAEGFSGRRIIITCHLWTNATMRLKVYAFLESLIMRRVRYVVAVSSAIEEIITTTGVESSKVKLIFNGIEIHKWQRDDLLDCPNYRKRLGLRQDSKILGLFGRLYAQKGHRYLLHALAQIKDKKIELICVGDGPLKHELQQLAEKLGIGDIVHFLGFRSDVKNLLQLADLFVMPSLDEGLPMALLEAMAMEKAVVVTPVGAIPSVIEDGYDGVFVPSKSVEELREAIIDLLDAPDRIGIIGRNARGKVIKRFSSEVMTCSYLEIYRDIIKNRPGK